MNGAIRIHDKAQLPGIFDDLRAMYRLSQGELASAAGVFQSQISDWLAGKRSMDVTNPAELREFAEYLKARCGELGFEAIVICADQLGVVRAGEAEA